MALAETMAETSNNILAKHGRTDQSIVWLRNSEIRQMNIIGLYISQTIDRDTARVANNFLIESRHRQI